MLRREHFRFWVNTLNMLADIYSTMGNAGNGIEKKIWKNRFKIFVIKFLFVKGEIPHLMFSTFNFMLTSPVLETLKIEELECLISSLLNVGLDLERECPMELALLKNSLRDAFIHASEPWARKVISDSNSNWNSNKNFYFSFKFFVFLVEIFFERFFFLLDAPFVDRIGRQWLEIADWCQRILFSYATNGGSEFLIFKASSGII